MENSSKSRRQVGTLLSDVEPETVRWLWEGRIPLGKITILDGDPGEGKSVIALDIGARVTKRREMPDGSPGLDGGVVLLGPEDGLGDTVRPRLDAAGADPSRVLDLTWIGRPEEGRLFQIPADLALLEEAITRVGAKIVIVDPLYAFLGGKCDGNKDQDIRLALAPLAKLAEKLGVAVLLIRHLNKDELKKAIYRGGGSIAVIGVARSGLLVTPLKNTEDKVLAATKSNLAPMPPSLRYRLSEAPNCAARVEWLGETPENATELLASPLATRPKRREAREFIESKLATGPVPSRELEAEALAEGYSKKTIQRARQEAGVVSTQTPDGWVVSLPAPDGQMVTSPQGGDGQADLGCYAGA